MSELVFNPDDLLSAILNKASSNKREGSYDDVSEDVLELADHLIKSLPEFDHCKTAKVKYLFKLGSWSKMGECAKTSGKWRHLTEFDFVIVLHRDTWMAFNLDQKSALLHHEISHIGVSEDKWSIRKHDTEEFLVTLKRYGAWNASLQAVTEIISQTISENGERLDE